MSKSKITDVDWLTVTLVPITRCESPDESCYLERQPHAGLNAAEAKRHAFEHPGHRVVRETIQRTSYLYRPATEEG